MYEAGVPRRIFTEGARERGSERRRERERERERENLLGEKNKENPARRNSPHASYAK